MASAEAMKIQGNKHFGARRFLDAADSYSKAIKLNPCIATYYTNRALAYLQVGNYSSAGKDCRKALELEQQSVKAYYYLGKASIGLGDFDDAIIYLTKANELAISQKEHYGDEIMSQLRHARRERFSQEEEKRTAGVCALQIYLNTLIDNDLEQRMEGLKRETHWKQELEVLSKFLDEDQDSEFDLPEPVETVLIMRKERLENRIVELESHADTQASEASEYLGLDESELKNYRDEITTLIEFYDERNRTVSSKIVLQLQDELDEIDRLIRHKRVERLEKELSKGSNDKVIDKSIVQKEVAIAKQAQLRKDQLNAMFAQLDERRKRREIPDYLCGKISLGLLREPVITPCGITYDKTDILSHLKRVGHFDPVTRQPLLEKQLIPNLAMKEVVEHFLQANPWAEYEDLA